MCPDVIRIGFAAGYWGDDQHAPRRLLNRASEVDYVSMDYLAEITMSVLKRQQQDDPSLGYARDFPHVVEDILDLLVENDVTLVTNAGGVNPRACQAEVLDIAAEAGVDLRVAAVTGDDIVDRSTEIRAAGDSLANLDTGDTFETIADDLVAANAYLGAFPIASALEENPDVVVTGRCVDAALALGPMIRAFGWDEKQFDRLASGTIAGHLLECGPQVTGGVTTDRWREIDFEEMGYPIVEMHPDGSFVVTKPRNTGGEVTRQTVTEQLLYEVKDPRAYRMPDVTADFTSVSITDLGDDRVAVTAAAGDPPPDTLKVTALYQDGYKAQLLLIYSKPDALAKARKADEIIRARLESAGLEFEEVDTSYLGYNGCHRGIGQSDAPDVPASLNETVLRIAVKAPDKATVRAFGAETLPVLMTGPPTVTPVIEGRPRPREVLSFWPCAVSRERIQPVVHSADSGETADD